MMRIRDGRRAATILAALAIAALSGCGILGGGEPAPNVILVVVDALRADHVGCYGYDRDTTPFVDSLAAGGTRAAECVAQAPWTAASMASVFTSLPPTAAGVGARADSTGRRDVMEMSCSALPADRTTLAEALAAAGYSTFAVITNPFLTAEFNMTQGFATVVEDALDAEGVVDAAVAAIDSIGAAAPGPFFAYLHFMDVHAPNDPPAAYRKMFPAIDSRPHLPEHGRGGAVTAADMPAAEFAEFRSHKIALYDGSLRYVDDQLRRLFRRLESAGLADGTVVVFAADHGEGLWDHGLRMGHGFSLYAEQLEVPLVVHGSGVPARRLEGVVRNLDIAPTLLALAGAEAPAAMTGADLLDGDGPRAAPAFSEDVAYGYELKSLRAGRYKYIADPAGLRPAMLFDKTADPGELDDLAAGMPAAAAACAASLDSVLAAVGEAVGEPVAVDEATRRRLRALGY